MNSIAPEPIMRLLSLADLRARGIPYSRVHLARLEKAGFPRRVHLSGNRVAWVEEEILTWMADRVAERDGLPRTKIKDIPT
jgi:prophage regulatory protein